MQTQTTPRPTDTLPSGGVINTGNAKPLKTLHMLIRGDSPMNGAIVEPIDNGQAKLLARAIQMHLSEEGVIQGEDTVLVHGCFYQFFSLMGQQFSLLDRMTQAANLSSIARRSVGMPSTSVRVTEADMDEFIHRQHKRVEAADIRAPYYLLPVYVLAANDNGLPGSDPSSAPSNEVFNASVAHILHATDREIEVLGFYQESAFMRGIDLPHEAVLGDLLNRALLENREYSIQIGPMSIHINEDVVSLPVYSQHEWNAYQPVAGCKFEAWDDAFRRVSRVAHRLGVRLNVYHGITWRDYTQTQDSRTVLHRAV